MKTKICPECKIRKSITEFHKCSTKKDGLAFYCKKCQSTRNKKHYQQHRKKLLEYSRKYWVTRRDQKRNNDLKAKYGITLDNYNCRLKQQRHKCAICKTFPVELHPRSKKQLPLAVDHNHKMGKVRGLLCRSCNQKLGIYEINKEKFEIYLNKFNDNDC